MSKTVLENNNSKLSYVPESGYSSLIDEIINTTRKNEGTSIHLHLYYTMDVPTLNMMILQALDKGQIEIVKFKQQHYESICNNIELVRKSKYQTLLSQKFQKQRDLYPHQLKTSIAMRSKEMNGFQILDITTGAGDDVLNGYAPIFSLNIIRVTIFHSDHKRTLIDMAFVGDILYTCVCCDRFKNIETCNFEAAMIAQEWNNRKTPSSRPCEIYKKDFLSETASTQDQTYFFRPNPILVMRLIGRFEKACTVEEFEILSGICQCAPLNSIHDYKSLVCMLRILKNTHFVSQLFYPIELQLRFLTGPPLTSFFGGSSIMKIYLPAYFGNKTAKKQLSKLGEELGFTVKVDHFLDGYEHMFCENFIPKGALSNLYCNGKFFSEDARDICTYVHLFWSHHRHEDIKRWIKKAIEILNVNANPIPFLYEWRSICCYLYALHEKDKPSIEYLKAIDSPLYYHYMSLNSSHSCKYRNEAFRRGILEEGVNNILSGSDHSLPIKRHNIDRLSFGNEEWVKYILHLQDDETDIDHLVNIELVESHK